MQLIEKTVSLQELSATFRVSEEWLRRNWKKLHVEKGMPEKCQLGWVWPRKSMEEWIDGNYAKPVAPALPVLSVDLTDQIHRTIADNQNKALRARYAGGRA